MDMALMRKILLVEDNEDNREAAPRQTFQSLGPMDGCEATQLIKAAPATASIPVIALTAHALSSDRAKSIEIGCADFDTKPVDLPRLLGKIKACLEAWRRPPEH
jgi:CheY-like chemotaxis protein